MRSESDTIKWLSSYKPRIKHGLNGGQSTWVGLPRIFADKATPNFDDLGPEPQLSDFYTPNDSQKEITFVLIRIPPATTNMTKVVRQA